MRILFFQQMISIIAIINRCDTTGAHAGFVQKGPSSRPEGANEADSIRYPWGRGGEPTSKQKEVSLAVDGKRSPLFTLGTRIGLPWPWIAHIHDYNLNLVFDSPTHEYL